MSFLDLHKISGSQIPTPEAGASTIFLNPAGILQIKHDTGRISTAETGKVSMSGLIDTDQTPWTSGYLPVHDGNKFTPTFVSGSSSFDLTTTTSGQVEIRVLLASGFITGSNQEFTFSGIDQSYDMLEVYGVFQSEASTGAHTVECYFNGDTTTTNYLSTIFRADEFGWKGVQLSVAGVGTVHASDKTNSDHGKTNPVHFFIPNYANTTKRKWVYTASCVWRHTNGNESEQYITLWKNQSRINMINLKINSGGFTKFISGTQVWLYGRKRQWVVMSGTLGTSNISHGLIVP